MLTALKDVNKECYFCQMRLFPQYMVTVRHYEKKNCVKGLACTYCTVHLLHAYPPSETTLPKNLTHHVTLEQQC